MPRSKIIYGDEVLIDLTGDTVTADTLAEGVTAHDAAGNAITGTMAVGGGNEAAYGWGKWDGLPVTPLSFPRNANCYITATGGEYEVATKSVSGNWGTFYAVSDVFNLAHAPLTVIHTVGSSVLLSKSYFIAFSDTAAITYTDTDFAVMCDNGELEYWAAGKNVASSLVRLAAGSVIKLVMTDSIFEIYVNDTLIRSVSHSLTTVYVSILLFQASTTYGTFTGQQGDGNFISFVVDDEPDIYPDDGYHTDGLYYVNLNNFYTIIDTLTGEV